MNPEELKALMAELLKPVTESVAALQGTVNTLQTAVTAIPKTAATPPITPPATPPATPPVTPPPGGAALPPEVNAQIQTMQQQVQRSNELLEEANKARLEAEKKSQEDQLSVAITNSLSKHTFADDRSRRLFEMSIRQAVKRTEAGDLIADNLPLDKFVEREIGFSQNLLAPKQTGGAGAANGGRGTEAGFDIDKIKAGMSREDMAAAGKAIAAHLG